jgi:hypothetical protein
MHQLNLRQLMSNQGIDYSTQNQIIEHITGQPQYTIMTWGVNLEQIPPLFQGMVMGYFQACAETQASLQAQQAQTSVEQMAMYQMDSMHQMNMPMDMYMAGNNAAMHSRRAISEMYDG